MKVALTIAGSDSSGGAGIQADLKTFQAHGVFGMSVITAVTVQNTQKVYDIQEMRPQIVYDQIMCLFDDADIHAVKIGMVSSIPLIESIASALKKVNLPPVILDPVMISKSGFKLLNTDAQAALIKNLFPLAEVVTPNIHEAEALTQQKINSMDEMRIAASEILKLGAQKVVVKGGHLDKNEATDILFDGHTYKDLQGPRIDTKNTHGTGCTFSSAIAANIALGNDFYTAVTDAKTYITGAIRHSLSIGKGCGPTHHFFDLYEKAKL
ncbi:MAG: bifunctional hydroxymethylpyrimidine kinase/phosphomethylpyrimidine kinase [Deltaproteobacteria bacterium]|nr:bifunctional hydroxymethylpyrimidine kinase/phosphomethylpyrimidine kinase [Deltaproteobacteria bacterium]